MPTSTPTATRSSVTSSDASSTGLIKDSIWMLLAESLAVPCGIVIAAILSRHLGAAGYGQFSLAATYVLWLEFISAGGLGRMSIQIMAKQQSDWRAVAGSIMSAHLLVGAAFTLVGFLGSFALCYFMRTPELLNYVWLLLADVLLFTCLAGYRSVLAGLGRFRERALVTATGFIARLLLTLLLVSNGFLVWGAINAFVGATALCLLVCFCLVRFPLRFDREVFVGLRPAIPLVFAALCIQIFGKTDLFMIKLLGYTIADVGIFSAAKNAAFTPALISFALSPVLLASLSRSLGGNDEVAAIKLAKQGLSIGALILPTGIIVAIYARQIITFVYGSSFEQASVVLPALFLGALLLVAITLATTVLTAFGFIDLILAFSLAMMLGNALAQPIFVAKCGMIGAAYCGLAVSVMFTIGALDLVRTRCKVDLPIESFVRSLFVCVAVAGLAMLPVPSYLIYVRTIFLVVSIPLLFFILGEPSVLLAARRIGTMFNQSKR